MLRVASSGRIVQGIGRLVGLVRLVVHRLGRMMVHGWRLVRRWRWRSLRELLDVY